MGKIVFSAVGSVSAAFMSMVCCSGPLFLAAAGLSGASLAASFRPFRPLFIAGMVVSLWLGFSLLDREDRACESGKPCADPASRRRMRRLLLLATLVSFLFATSPIWAPWLV